MTNFSQTLRQKGYRVTSPRQRIIEALTDHPQSVEEIVATLRARSSTVDKVTVYRTLDCFVDVGIVGKTQFTDKVAKYELLSETDHHHHLVCNQCGAVEDIPLNDDSFMKKISKQTHFKVTSHSLEFFGICANCQ